MQSRLSHTARFTIVEIAGLVVFAAVVALLASFLKPQLSGVGLLAAGVVLALVPSLLWLIVFYQEDRIEPEPKQYIIGVFLLGALLAVAVGQPLIREVFHAQDIIGTNIVVDILLSILVVGVVQEFCKYAAVRYSVFNSSVFDERVDGILYGASAGLGYAFALNVQYVLDNNGVDLGVGVMRMVVVALAQASFAGVMGYFLGRAKFDKMGPLWLPIGLLVSATLNGIVSYVLGRITFLGSFAFNPWYGLIAAVVVAGIVFAVILNTMQGYEREEAAQKS
jgi:RsiW-degrading membrane proteinase PrsW (M82 family)